MFDYQSSPVDDLRPHHLYEAGEGSPPFHEGRRTGRRGLECRVGHFVGDAPVDLVADAGPHRDTQFGDSPGDHLGVEGHQVGSRTSPPHQGDDVGLVGGHHAQPLGDVVGHPLALDSGVALQNGEGQAAVAQLRGEVGVGGRPDTGH